MKCPRCNKEIPYVIEETVRRESHKVFLERGKLKKGDLIDLFYRSIFKCPYCKHEIRLESIR